MGDVIHTLPSLSDAHKRFPDIQFDWVVEEGFAEIPRWHSAVKQVIPIALRRWRHNLHKAIKSGEIAHFWKTLRTQNYDYIIDAQGLIKSALISCCAHGIRYGYDKNSIREPSAAFFYQHRFNISKNQHAILRIQQLFANVLNYKIEQKESALIPDYKIKQNFLLPTKQEKNYVVFIHGSSRADKCWPEKNWITLTKLATNTGLIVKLPWGNDEEFARAKRIAEQCHNVEVLPKSNLTSLATILTNSKGAVAVDTGLGHLAAALEVPTVSLYGPTNPDLIGTLGKNQIHLMNFKEIDADAVWKKLF